MVIRAALTTGLVARILDVSEGTIRNFERRGVLHAERTASGFRLFDPAEVARVKGERAIAIADPEIERARRVVMAR